MASPALFETCGNCPRAPSRTAPIAELALSLKVSLVLFDLCPYPNPVRSGANLAPRAAPPCSAGLGQRTGKAPRVVGGQLR